MSEIRRIRNRAIESPRLSTVTRLETPNRTDRWFSAPHIASYVGCLTSVVLAGIMLAKMGPEMKKLSGDMEALNSSMENDTQQAKLAAATIEDMEDPARKAASELALRTAQLTFAKAADELLDASTPALQGASAPAAGEDGHFAVPVTIKNTGTRGVWLANLRIRMAVKPTVKNWASYKVQPCSLGYLPPGGTLSCPLIAELRDVPENTEQVTYQYTIDAKPYLMDSSLSTGLLMANYPKSLVEKRLIRTWTYEGTLFNSGWSPTSVQN